MTVPMGDLRPKNPSIACPECSKVSYHPADIKHKYCGNCHMFHADMEWLRAGGYRPGDAAWRKFKC